MGLRQESSTGGSLEHLTDAFVGSCRALEVLVSADLLADFLTLRASQNFGSENCSLCSGPYLFRADGPLGCLVQLLDCLGVVAKILFASNEDDGETLAEVKNFRNPLVRGQLVANK